MCSSRDFSSHDERFIFNEMTFKSKDSKMNLLDIKDKTQKMKLKLH
jgi:hypothetical protein